MDEYISRQEAINALYEVYEHEYPTASGDFDEYARHDVRNVLNGLPSADVQPVRYGKWELISQNKFTGTKTLRCTYCKNYFVVRDDTLNAGRGDANFCPNCGSKQDLGGD